MKLFSENSDTENASLFENCVTFGKDKHYTQSIALCTRESTETLLPNPTPHRPSRIFSTASATVPGRHLSPLHVITPRLSIPVLPSAFDLTHEASHLAHPRHMGYVSSELTHLERIHSIQWDLRTRSEKTVSGDEQHMNKSRQEMNIHGKGKKATAPRNAKPRHPVHEG